MNEIALIREKLRNRLEEEKLAIAIRDHYAEATPQRKEYQATVEQIHNKVMELTYKLQELSQQVAVKV